MFLSVSFHGHAWWIYTGIHRYSSCAGLTWPDCDLRSTWGCDLQTSTLVWQHWLCHRNILMCWCVPISLLGHNLYVLARSVEPQPVAPWKDPLANQLPKYHKSHPVWLAAPCKWLLLAWLCDLHILENKNLYSGIKPQFRVTCPGGKC